MMFKAFKKYAGTADRERSDAFEKWSSSSSTLPDISGQPYECWVMICTAAFNCGIDVDGVVLVVHVSSSYSILSSAQESGRCGRHERPATSIIIASDAECASQLVAIKSAGPVTPSHSKTALRSVSKSSSSPQNDDFVQNDIKSNQLFGSLHRRILDNDSRTCLRWLLDYFLRGVGENKGAMLAIFSERGMVRCDACNENQVVPRATNTTRTAFHNGDEPCIFPSPIQRSSIPTPDVSVSRPQLTQKFSPSQLIRGL